MSSLLPENVTRGRPNRVAVNILDDDSKLLAKQVKITTRM